MGFIRVGKRRGETHITFFKKEPERQGEKSVWREMKGALRWEQIAQKAGGWQRVKITRE